MISFSSFFKKSSDTQNTPVSGGNSPDPTTREQAPVNPSLSEKKTIKDLKKFLKELADQIRLNRSNLKENCRIYRENPKSLPSGYKQTWDRFELSKKYRHHHIAYCELRGKKRDQIEKPHPNNLPNEELIQKVKDEYGTKDVHPGS